MTIYKQRSVDGVVTDGQAIPAKNDPELMATLRQIKDGLHPPFYYCGRDEKGRLWVGPHRRPSTREEMIQGWVDVPHFTPSRNAAGWSVMGEAKRYTVEEATDKVDRLYPDLIPAAPPPEKDQ